MTVSSSQTGVYHDYTTAKSWADLALDLGWMHNADWVQVNVTTSGTYNIRSEILGLRNVDQTTWFNENRTIHPAFSVWALGGSTFTTSGSAQNPAASTTSPSAYGYTGPSTNSNMGFNQVAKPAVGNNSQFLLNAGVTDIVGYSNSGFAGWYNGNGDYVGTGGGVGAPWTGAVANSGTTADGFYWTDLTVNLAAGSYVIAVGGSCVNNVDCGPVTSYTVNKKGTTYNYGTGFHELTVKAVPVPAAVWLFGSALMGMTAVSRKKAIAA